MRYAILLLSILFASCSISSPNYDYEIDAQFKSFAKTVDGASIYGNFRELSSDHIFMVKMSKEQSRQFYENWEGTLFIDKQDNTLVLVGTTE